MVFEMVSNGMSLSIPLNLGFGVNDIGADVNCIDGCRGGCIGVIGENAGSVILLLVDDVDVVEDGDDGGVDGGVDDGDVAGCILSIDDCDQVSINVHFIILDSQ